MNHDDANPLKRLIELSKHDASLARIKSERLTTENNLLDIKKRSDAAVRSAAELAENLKEARYKYDREEKRLKEERDKVVERRRSLTTLQSYKLQQAAERELEQAARALGQQEETLIAALEDIDKLEKKANEAAESSESLQKELERAEKDAAATYENLKGREVEHTEAREELAKLIASGHLQTYQKVQGRHPTDPVVPVLNNGCSGCFMQVVPQLIVEISRGQTLVRCRGCGRILYLEEMEAE